MSHIIIVTGSARPNSISTKIAPLVGGALKSDSDDVIEVIDVATLDLPFYNAPVPASHEDFAPDNEHVIAWTKKVGEADGVVLLTPEYNGNMTAIQKNALDWVYKEWNDKPVALIGYGWYEPSRAHTAARISLEVVKAQIIEPFAQLQFMKDITLEGDVLDNDTVAQKLSATIDALRNAL